MSIPILLALLYGFICLISSVTFDTTAFIILILIEFAYDVTMSVLDRLW